MSVAPRAAKAVTAPASLAAAPAAPAAAHPPLMRGRAGARGLLRRATVRLRNEWLPRAAWTISRTGRPGLVGIGLLLAAASFLVSTHLRVASEVQTLRADLATAQLQARTVGVEKVGEPGAAIHALPLRADMPAILRQLFDEATRAHLAVDTAKYELNVTKSSGVVRYQIAFPVTGPYPQIRAFIDAALATMPAVSLHDLALDRKSIADGSLEAQIRMTVYTRSGP